MFIRSKLIRNRTPPAGFFVFRQSFITLIVLPLPLLTCVAWYFMEQAYHGPACKVSDPNHPHHYVYVTIQKCTGVPHEAKCARHFHLMFLKTQIVPESAAHILPRAVLRIGL
jgi:hypothetical protein